MEELDLITIDKVAEILKYDDGYANPKRNAQIWLRKRNIKAFRRGYYFESAILETLKKEKDKCYNFARGERKAFIKFEGLSNMGIKASTSTDKVQALVLNQKRQNMLTN